MFYSPIIEQMLCAHVWPINNLIINYAQGIMLSFSQISTNKVVKYFMHQIQQQDYIWEAETSVEVSSYSCWNNLGIMDIA